MRNFQEAKSLVDQRLGFIQPGRGSERYVRFLDGYPGEEAVRARYAETDVATFYPDGVKISTNGWLTQTTAEAIGTALGDPGAFGFYLRVPFIYGSRYAEGMRIGYDKQPIAPLDFSEQLPLAPGRSVDLVILGTAASDNGHVVIVRDNTKDETYRDRTTPARHLARAHVGRRTAKTTVLARLDETSWSILVADDAGGWEQTYADYLSDDPNRHGIPDGLSADQYAAGQRARGLPITG